MTKCAMCKKEIEGEVKRYHWQQIPLCDECAENAEFGGFPLKDAL